MLFITENEQTQVCTYDEDGSRSHKFKLKDLQDTDKMDCKLPKNGIKWEEITLP